MPASNAVRLVPGVTPAPTALVKDVSGLVSPPDICMRIFELLQSPDSSARDVGDVIMRDANLTARLLKIVNSPFYNFPRRIDTVSRAIAVVGTRDLYNLVVAVSAVRTFSNLATDLVSMDTFWRHSLFTALAARDLAQHCQVLHPERLFVAGMLHDLGSLVLYHRLPELSRDLLLVAGGDEGRLYEAELDGLGFGHPELGGLLLELWNIPDSLQSAVRHHHRPEAADTENRLEAAILHVSESLANQSGVGGFCEDAAQDTALSPRIWALLDLDADEVDIEAMTERAGIELTETAGLVLQR